MGILFFFSLYFIYLIFLEYFDGILEAVCYCYVILIISLRFVNLLMRHEYLRRIFTLMMLLLLSNVFFQIVDKHIVVADR